MTVPKIAVTGLSVAHSVNTNPRFYIVAFGSVAIPEMELTVRDVGLARSGNKWVAVPPKAPGSKAADNPIKWNYSGEFAEAVRDELLDAYFNLTGSEPPTLERPHVTS